VSAECESEKAQTQRTRGEYFDKRCSPCFFPRSRTVPRAATFSC